MKWMTTCSMRSMKLCEPWNNRHRFSIDIPRIANCFGARVRFERIAEPLLRHDMPNIRFQFLTAVIVLSMEFVPWASAQHDHNSGSRAAVSPPKVFLDKSPKIVEYQLKRLSDEQLLLVERATDDPKYLPVFNAILSREGMPRAYRDEALSGLVAIKKTDAVLELISALDKVSGEDPAAARMIESLAGMLLVLPAPTLNGQLAALANLAASPQSQKAAVGFAALIAAGRGNQAWLQAEERQQLAVLLSGVALVPEMKLRNEQHGRIVALLATHPPASIGVAALSALANLTAEPELTFQRAAELIENAELQSAAVKALLSVTPDRRDGASSLKLVQWLVEYAERTPAAERTADSFLDAMELVDQLLAKTPSAQAKAYRDRLRETVVRMVRIHTVEEEMRYDTAYFAVEAGRPVQIVLINEDLMPHNLVITAPGALQEVADLGMEAGPNAGLDGKQYVPKSDKVLFATDMVAAREQTTLTFTAPQAPGEYPYVCTFPRHWMRMYGVMVVVDDLDAWQKQPTVPKDPIGSNRHFVQSWTLSDFHAELSTGLRGRSSAIGEKLFAEATCAQCHRIGTVGVGNVGPDLSEVFTRWKGDAGAVLQEILDPSHRIDDKYAVHVLITVDGQTVSGLVIEDSKDALSIMENPEAKEPRVIARADIDQMRKTANSMMPKGLLDRYSKDEVFEILAYIGSLQKKP